MTNDTYLAALFEAVLFPPGLSITLALTAYIVPNEEFKGALCAAAFLSLYVASIPITTSWIRRKLEVFPPVTPADVTAEAIVVLGADRYIGAPEYAGDTLHGFGLERLRYAAWLQKRTGLPILVSGGAVLGEEKSEAELMSELLLQEFGANVRWSEGESKTTYENALYSSKMLKEAGIGEVLLVTHAWAMPRAYEAFTKAGVRVTAAPTGFLHNSGVNAGLFAWLPSASSLFRTQLALHELTGRLWYRLRYF